MKATAPPFPVPTPACRAPYSCRTQPWPRRHIVSAGTSPQAVYVSGLLVGGVGEGRVWWVYVSLVRRGGITPLSTGGHALRTALHALLVLTAHTLVLYRTGCPGGCHVYVPVDHLVRTTAYTLLLSAACLLAAASKLALIMIKLDSHALTTRIPITVMHRLIVHHSALYGIFTLPIKLGSWRGEGGR